MSAAKPRGENDRAPWLAAIAEVADLCREHADAAPLLERQFAAPEENATAAVIDPARSRYRHCSVIAASDDDGARMIFATR